MAVTVDEASRTDVVFGPGGVPLVRNVLSWVLDDSAMVFGPNGEANIGAAMSRAEKAHAALGASRFKLIEEYKGEMDEVKEDLRWQEINELEQEWLTIGEYLGKEKKQRGTFKADRAHETRESTYEFKDPMLDTASDSCFMEHFTSEQLRRDQREDRNFCIQIMSFVARATGVAFSCGIIELKHPLEVPYEGDTGTGAKAAKGHIDGQKFKVKI